MHAVSDPQAEYSTVQSSFALKDSASRSPTRRPQSTLMKLKTPPWGTSGMVLVRSVQHTHQYLNYSSKHVQTKNIIRIHSIFDSILKNPKSGHCCESAIQLSLVVFRTQSSCLSEGTIAHLHKHEALWPTVIESRTEWIMPATS